MPDLDAGKYEVGVASIGGLGRNVAEEMSGHLFTVAAYSAQPQKKGRSASRSSIYAAQSLPELATVLKKPRIIFIVGETSSQTDAIVDELLPNLSPEDMLIDAGESFFKDTAQRARKASGHGVDFIGLGVTGREPGRPGGAILAGGRREACARARPYLEAVAANVSGEPSIGYLGSAPAAQLARIVHAGIDCALWQLVSETLSLMQQTLHLGGEEVFSVLGDGHGGPLNGHFNELAGEAFDSKGLHHVEENLLAMRKSPIAGWIKQCTRECGVAMPTIDAALNAQQDLAQERQKSLVSTPFRHPFGHFGNDAKSVVEELAGALYAAMTIAYAEGLGLLAASSKRHGLQYEPLEVTRLWKTARDGRSTVLNDISDALRVWPRLENILCDEDLAEKVMDHQESLRHAVWRASELNAVVPSLVAALDYLDSSRDIWLPVNLMKVTREEIGLQEPEDALPVEV
jgi:6-phosphogluconate dehydrogenase